MNELLAPSQAWAPLFVLLLVSCALAGAALGAMFFGGLWWTTLRGAASPRPALWFFCSLVLRMGLTLAGFQAVGGGHWQRLAACLLGFVAGRMLVMWLTRPPQGSAGSARETSEARHAPES